MSAPRPEAYAPLLIAALEHERVCYATVLQVESEHAQNADARLAEGYQDRVREVRERWRAATALVQRLQQVLQLAD